MNNFHLGARVRVLVLDTPGTVSAPAVVLGIRSRARGTNYTVRWRRSNGDLVVDEVAGVYVEPAGADDDPDSWRGLEEPRKFAAGYPFTKLERFAEDLYDGEHPVIMVEVFDHPAAKDTPEGEGVWFIGFEDKVLGWLETNGWTDFEVQLRLAPAE